MRPSVSRPPPGRHDSWFSRRLPEDSLLLGLVVMGVCLLASGLGVRLALKIDPAQALGG